MIEKLIKKRGNIRLHNFEGIYQGGRYLGYIHQGYDDVTYEWEYIYDEALFVGGSFGMREVTTGAMAVFSDNVKGKVTPDKCIGEFKRKLGDKNIHHVIENSERLNLYNLELCLESLLII